MTMLIRVPFILSDDISSNIEISHAATTQATSQLVKASKAQKSGSSLVNFDQSDFSFVSFFSMFFDSNVDKICRCLDH
jgi:hypothetical protein